MDIKNKIIKNKELIIIILIALFVRLILAPYFNYIDIVSYHLQWVKEIDANGLFSIYNNSLVDYPPIFLLILSFLKNPILFSIKENNRLLFMFLFKIVPIIVDCILTYQIYKVYGKKISLLWAFNIGAIVNCAMFGQTDSFLCLFIFLMILSFKNNENWKAILYFTLGCLTKLQMCYFAPLFIVYILFVNKENFKKKVSYILFGISLGYAIWVPWIIGIKNLWLPFRIYLDGFNKYDKINMNALNFTYKSEYIINDMNSYSLFGIPLSTVNILIYLTIIIISVFLLIKIKNFEIVSSIYLLSIYMFTFSQHERYTMSFLIVALICYASYKNKKLLRAYLLCAFTTGLIEVVYLLLANLSIEKIIGYEFYFYIVNYIRPFVLLNVLAYILLIIFIGGYYKENVTKNKNK